MKGNTPEHMAKMRAMRSPDYGKRAAKTNKERYGKDFYVKLGRIGGQRGTGHAFAHGKVDPGVAGMMGGKISSKSLNKLPLETRRLHAEFKQGFNEPTMFDRIKGVFK